MANNWVSLDEAASLTKKSVHTLRKTINKPTILTKKVNNKIFIEKNSILSHYNIEEKKEELTNNQSNINQNNEISHLLSEINWLIRDNKKLNEDYSKEKIELWNKIVLLERKKDEEILNINISKNEEILEKDKKILKISRQRDMILFFCFIFATFFTISAIFLYKMLNI